MIMMLVIIVGYEVIVCLIYLQQIEYVGWVVLVGLVGFIGNEWVVFYCIRVGYCIGLVVLIVDGLYV